MVPGVQKPWPTVLGAVAFVVIGVTLLVWGGSLVHRVGGLLGCAFGVAVVVAVWRGGMRRLIPSRVPQSSTGRAQDVSETPLAPDHEARARELLRVLVDFHLIHPHHVEIAVAGLKGFPWLAAGQPLDLEDIFLVLEERIAPGERGSWRQGESPPEVSRGHRLAYWGLEQTRVAQLPEDDAELARFNAALGLAEGFEWDAQAGFP